MRYPLLLLSLLFIGHSCMAQSNDFAYREAATSLSLPWDLEEGPNGDIWFTEKLGTVSRLVPATGFIKELCFIGDVNNQGEGGLLGMALHPNFPTTPHVYLTYNYRNAANQIKEKIVIYRYDNDSLYFHHLITGDISGAGIHNGSRILIHQNHLYVSTGDAANTSLAQNTSSLNGKILRYNLDGTIPTDNPLPGSAIWSWGHRNPQGLIVQNNQLISSEHGPSSDDEINIIQKGRNYGWPNVAGFCNTTSEITFCNDSNVKEPLIAWTPTLAVCGLDYNTHSLFPQWQNKLLMTTLKASKLFVLSMNSSLDSISHVDTITSFNYGRLRDVLVASNGKIYVCTSNGAGSDKIIEIYDPTPTSVKEVEGNKKTWVYPQPADEVLRLGRTNKEKGNWKIVNLQGQQLAKGQLYNTDDIIPIHFLSSGMYLLHWHTESHADQIIKFQKR